MMPPIDVLYPDVYLLRAEVGGRPLQLPLLVGSERALLIDTGCAGHPESVILPAFDALGLPLTRLGFIVTTHSDFDHHGGNACMKRAAPRALLCCGTADRAAIESPATIWTERYDAYRREHGHAYSDDVKAWITGQLGAPQRVDLAVGGGERLRLGTDWEVDILHLPGHSHGHLGVWDRKHNVLFGGDAIHGAVYRDLRGAAALCPTYLHVEPYLATIARIESLALDGYVGCHWPAARSPAAVRAFCAESRAFVANAEAGMLGALREAGPGGMGLIELCMAVGPSLGDWPREIDLELCYAFGGHLADLTARHVIRESGTGVPRRYALSRPSA